MVKQFSVAGPVQRAMGVRLHSEMGDAGEAIWAKVTGGDWIGYRPLEGWKKQPPIDVIDRKNKIGYQIKVITDPTHRISFSGAHREIKSRTRTLGGKVVVEYVGVPEQKLERIREFLNRHGLQGWLIVMLLDEDANRAIVYSKKGVHNVQIKDMTPIGVIDNDTGTFFVPGPLREAIEEEGLPIPDHVTGLPRFPDIPTFLRSSTDGEVVPVHGLPGVKPLFRRVKVRKHFRRTQ